MGVAFNNELRVFELHWFLRTPSKWLTILNCCCHRMSIWLYLWCTRITFMLGYSYWKLIIYLHNSCGVEVKTYCEHFHTSHKRQLPNLRHCVFMQSRHLFPPKNHMAINPYDIKIHFQVVVVVAWFRICLYNNHTVFPPTSRPHSLSCFISPINRIENVVKRLCARVFKWHNNTNEVHNVIQKINIIYLSLQTPPSVPSGSSLRD